MSGNKRFRRFYNHLIENETNKKYDIQDCCNLLNDLSNEKKQLKSIINTLTHDNTKMKKVLNTTKNENEQIKQVIKEAYETERTHIGKSVLKQLMEQIQ